VMATVKGDVHDIGKNIVGVVLQCNNYDVIDMGVMVPTEDIIARAKDEKADIIGLSGLITPSLDRMVDVAAEMTRQGLDLPLLIGGATTSKKHTALRIAPEYEHGVIHVDDASKAVGVVSRLLSAERRSNYLAEIAEQQQAVRGSGNRLGSRPTVPIEAARANAFDGDWEDYTPPRPNLTGLQVFDNVPVDGLVVTSLTPLVLYSNPPWLAQGVTYVFGPENIRPISFSTYKSNPLCSPGEVPLCETSTGQPCNPWTGGNCICKCGPGQLASASSQADKRSRQAMMRGLRSRAVNPGGTCYAGYAHGHECKGQ